MIATTQTHSHKVATPSSGERARLGRRAQLLAGACVAYSVVEAAVAITDDTDAVRCGDGACTDGCYDPGTDSAASDQQVRQILSLDKDKR